MSKGYLLESDVENLALNTLQTVGYKVFKSPTSSGPSPIIDAARDNDHSSAILFDNLNKALRRLNPGYEEEIYKDAFRQIIRLADHKKAVEVLGEEKLHLIAQELVKLVKKEAGVDWEKRRNIQAKMRVAVKHLLRKYGYPPDIAPAAVDTVVEQAELMAADD